MLLAGIFLSDHQGIFCSKILPASHIESSVTLVALNGLDQTVQSSKLMLLRKFELLEDCSQLTLIEKHCPNGLHMTVRLLITAWKYLQPSS